MPSCPLISAKPAEWKVQVRVPVEQLLCRQNDDCWRKIERLNLVPGTLVGVEARRGKNGEAAGCAIFYS